jgi:hypothetical protein
MDPIQQVADVLGGPQGAMGSVAAKLMANGLNMYALVRKVVLRK